MRFSRFPALFAAAVLTAATLVAGCGGGGVEMGPPEGWLGEGDRWWTDGTDTTSAFRDLSSLESMGVTNGAPTLSASGTPTDEQVTFAVKEELKKLYRKDPETVDSLFAAYVAPKIADVPREGDIQSTVKEFGRESHDAITKHFYEPVQTLSLQDLDMPYPDSLRSQGGSVWMQVRVSDEGEPQAVKLLEGAHPVLNDVVRRAATQMRWEPARVRKGEYGWRDIPSWTWVNVRLG